MISAERTPSGARRQAVGRPPACRRRVRVAHERAEQSLYPCGGPRESSRAASRLAQQLRIARDRGGHAPARPTDRSGCPGRTPAPRSAPPISNQSRFLRPGNLADDGRADRTRSVSNMSVTRSSVRRGRPGGPRWLRALRRAIRWPLTNSTRSHQCEPMSANAARGAAEPGVDAPVAAVPAQQPVLALATVEQPQGPRRPRCSTAAAHGARSGSSGTRRAPRDSPAAAAASTAPRAPRSSVASGFSQITFLPARSAASATVRWRWFGVQTCTTSRSAASTSSSAVACERSAPSAAAAGQPSFR